LVPKTEHSSWGFSPVESSTIFCQNSLRQIFHLVIVIEQFLFSVLGEMFLYCAKWHDYFSELSFAASTVNLRSAPLRGKIATRCSEANVCEKNKTCYREYKEVRQGYFELILPDKNASLLGCDALLLGV
jgi:hypothetical protein